MEFRVRLFNNTVESNQFKLQIPKSSLQAPTTSLFETLTYSLQKHFNLASGQFVVLSKNGIKLNQDSLIENGQMLQICPTVLGGKGGFGSLLRAFGKQMQQSTNKEACRDLTGRRIRHVNNERKLKEFVEKQADIAKEKEEKKREKLEKRKKKRADMEHSHHLFVDPNYDKQKEKISQDLDEAIVKAIAEKKHAKETPVEKKEEASSSEPMQKGASLIDINKKTAAGKDKFADWMGCGDLEVSSTSEDESEEENTKAKSKGT